MKRLSIIAFSMLILCLFLTACSSSGEDASTNSSSSDDGEQLILKTGLTVGDWAPHYEGLAKLKELVEEKSDGQIIIEEYPDSQLGGEREMLEGVQQGTLEMALISSSVFAAFDQRAAAIDIPYLVTNFEEAEAMMDGPVGDELAKILEEVGMKVLSWGHNDFRIISNDVKPIETPEDIEGIKMRVAESQVLTDWYTELGALSTTLPFPDIYNALQQGVADGQDNGPILTFASKFTEHQQYVTVSNHQYSPVGFFINLELWNSLTDEQQTILKEASEEAAIVEREAIKEFNEMAVGEMENSGVEVTELSDSEMEAFIKTGKDLAEELKSEMDDAFLDLVLEEVGF